MIPLSQKEGLTEMNMKNFAFAAMIASGCMAIIDNQKT